MTFSWRNIWAWGSVLVLCGYSCRSLLWLYSGLFGSFSRGLGWSFWYQDEQKYTVMYLAKALGLFNEKYAAVRHDRRGPKR